MSANEKWLPLFLLNTVLFPNGILPLKVFETRYLDMVRDCVQNNSPFGIVLIKSGQEVGVAAVPENVGCIAHITNWDAPQLGVLLLRTQGGSRFRILETRLHKDQHLEARVEILDNISGMINKEHTACARSLELLINNIKLRAEHRDVFEYPYTETMQLHDAGWIAHRWSEILPIPLQAKQKLLELDDPQLRLTIIHQYLQQHHII